MTHHQMTFDLLQGIQYHTHQNQQGGSSEELGELGADTGNLCEGGHDGHNSEEYRTGQRDTRHNGVDVCSRFLTGLYAGNEAVVALHVIRPSGWVVPVTAV